MPYVYSPDNEIGIYRASPIRFTCTLVGAKEGYIKRGVQVYLASRQAPFGNGGSLFYIDPDDNKVYFLTAIIMGDTSKGTISSLGFITYDDNNEQINKAPMTPEFTHMDLFKLSSLTYDDAVKEYGLSEPVFDLDTPIANGNVKPAEFTDISQRGGKRRTRRTRRTKKHKRT
jgi:hypothetical protein